MSHGACEAQAEDRGESSNADTCGSWVHARGGSTGGTRCRRQIAVRSLSVRCRLLVLLLVLVGVAAANADYYRLLGVRKTADTATIKKAYKDLAKKYHPDKYKGTPPVQMEDLNRAHEVLTDPDLRKQYDMYGLDPDRQEVRQREEQRKRQQEYANHLHNIFGHGGGRRSQQYIESSTQTLTSHNYEELVNGLGQVWLIQVWRDSHCPHCAEIAPQWEEAAKELRGVVHFGRINYDRNSVLLNFRLRQLPTIFAVTTTGEVRLMNGRNGYSADEMVKFASGIVSQMSTVVRIEGRGAAKKWLERSADRDKNHVILFDKADWAVYHSAAMAPAWKDSMVFAAFLRPSSSANVVHQYGINTEERTVVIVREDGSFVKKTGIRSRKVLVRYLLQNQHPLTPKVTAHNWPQLCLGIGSAQGLHTIEHLLPARRQNASVCVLSVRNLSDESARPELEVMRETAKLMLDGGSGWTGSERVQFGWIVAQKDDKLWQYLVQKRLMGTKQDETIAMIDWQRGWAKALAEDEVDKSRSAQQLLAWVKEGLEEAEETQEEIPVVPFRRSAVEKILSMFSRDEQADVGDDKAGRPLNGSIWMGLMCGVLALINFALSKAPGSRGREEPRRRPDNSNSRGQARGAADDGPRPSPSASAHGSSQPSRAGATSGAAGAGSRGGRDSSTQSGAGASASGGAAGGDDGARHRKPAASGGETGFDPHQKADLNARLGDLSGAELRKIALSQGIDISDCLQKDEIVSRIMQAI